MKFIKNECVYEKKELQTKNQLATVLSYYDQEYHTKLTTDKSNILADGTDTATITAEVYNYLNEPQQWAGDIVFELDGVQQIVATTNGQASITFTSSSVGDFLIKTNIPNFRNGEVTIHAE